VHGSGFDGAARIPESGLVVENNGGGSGRAAGEALSDAQKQIGTVLLAQFTALRAEIQNRSTAQAAIVSLNITAIG
jgi:hypothetical protein